MKKFIFIFIFIFFFTTILLPVNALDDVHLVLDSNNSTSLPKNFRTTTDLTKAAALTSLNITGLDTLNISGSGQFTEFNLPLLIDSIPNDFSITIIDLRG